MENQSSLNNPKTFEKQIAFNTIKRCIKKIKRDYNYSIAKDSKLIELNLDNLDIIDLCFQLETQHQLKSYFSEEEIKNWNRISDILNTILNHTKNSIS